MDGQSVKATERGGVRADVGGHDRHCNHSHHAQLTRTGVNLFKHPLRKLVHVELN
jgi:hypothetical protein